MNLNATFDLTGDPWPAPPGAELDWSRAEIQVGVSDVRGALTDATLTSGGKTWNLGPTEISEDVPKGDDRTSTAS